VLFDSKSLGYVVATHQAGRDHGQTVWTWYLPLTDASPRAAREVLLSADWKHWAEVVLADLRRAHPDLEALVERLDVWRWGHAMVRPTPGVLKGGALEAARRPVGRLHFAHTDLSGMALFEEAQAWGVRAADAVLGARPSGAAARAAPQQRQGEPERGEEQPCSRAHRDGDHPPGDGA
jgi:hypothetical protein